MLIYDQIKENSIIMIEFENGTKDPYFVNQKAIGHYTKATMLLGVRLSELIKKPEPFPRQEDRFYIANENVKGKDVEVIGYRELSVEEKVEWLKKIEAIKALEPLQKFFLD